MANSRFSELLDLEQRFFLFKRFVGTALPTIGKKLLLDQCVITPPILAIFYVGNTNTVLSIFLPLLFLAKNCELTRQWSISKLNSKTISVKSQPFSELSDS
jgi:hypothetical protein